MHFLTGNTIFQSIVEKIEKFLNVRCLTLVLLRMKVKKDFFFRGGHRNGLLNSQERYPHNGAV